MEDRPNSIPWPPLIYTGAALAGLIATWLLPLPWPSNAMWLSYAGYAVVIFAVSLEVWATLQFKREKTTILPHRSARHLITSGPFAWSRNPIYLGNTLLILGFGLAFSMAWLVFVAFPAAFLTQKLAIEREETHLARRFGKVWTDYAACTRRWFGKRG